MAKYTENVGEAMATDYPTKTDYATEDPTTKQAEPTHEQTMQQMELEILRSSVKSLTEEMDRRSREEERRVAMAYQRANLNTVFGMLSALNEEDLAHNEKVLARAIRNVAACISRSPIDPEF